MNKYIVLYRDSYISVLESPLRFICCADDVEHAIEQTINAYSDACIVRVDRWCEMKIKQVMDKASA